MKRARTPAGEEWNIRIRLGQTHGRIGFTTRDLSELLGFGRLAVMFFIGASALWIFLVIVLFDPRFGTAGFWIALAPLEVIGLVLVARILTGRWMVHATRDRVDWWHDQTNVWSERGLIAAQRRARAIRLQVRAGTALRG